jgi:hypothetical protein
MPLRVGASIPLLSLARQAARGGFLPNGIANNSAGVGHNRPTRLARQISMKRTLRLNACPAPREQFSADMFVSPAFDLP